MVPVTDPHDPTTDGPDDRDLDEGGLDLTPRDLEAAASRRRSGKRWVPLAVLGALAVVVVLILMQAGDASLYFRNADEAVAEKDELIADDTKFRLQGTVVGVPTSTDDAIAFTVQYGGVDVDIRHTGSEPALFDSGVPVVAEGRWNPDGTVFESEKLLIRHDEDYEDYDEENPERLDGDESNDS